MSLTFDELLQCEERLQTEIVERECLLAAVRVLRGHAAKGQSLATLDLSVLGSALLRSPQKALVLESAATEDSTTSALPPAPEPAALPPPPPPPPRYVHPDFNDWKFRGHGGDSAAVRWAIERMTGDFSLPEIATLLEREGRGLKNSQISVVLTRLKGRGELDELERSNGPKPAVFRRPDWALPLEEITAQPLDSEATAETVGAAA